MFKRPGLSAPSPSRARSRLEEVLRPLTRHRPATAFLRDYQIPDDPRLNLLAPVPSLVTSNLTQPPLRISHRTAPAERRRFYDRFRVPQAAALEALLGPPRPAPRPPAPPIVSILKAAPVVNPHLLDPAARRDFSTLKAVALLMGLPVACLDDFVSRLWEQYSEIGRLNSSVQRGALSILLGRFNALTPGSMQNKLRRLSKQTEIFQRLRLILFKGNLKVNLPLTFKSNNHSQPHHLQSKRSPRPGPMRTHHPPLPRINFRPHLAAQPRFALQAPVVPQASFHSAPRPGLPPSIDFQRQVPRPPPRPGAGAFPPFPALGKRSQRKR